MACSVDTKSRIFKHGPNLSAPLASIDYLKDMGFNMVAMANNHILDFGSESLRETISRCKKIGVDYVGAGKNFGEAEETLIKKVKDKTFINCCEHEFTIATVDSAGANPLHPIRQFYKIREAKSTADYVIVIVHGGVENYQLPSPRMKETYRFLIDAGADAVINHHQHCYHSYEIYNGKPIFYGLGNFCFDWPNMLPTWYEGYMVNLYLDNERVSFELIPYVQCRDSIFCVMTDDEKAAFENNIHELNDIILDDSKLNEEYRKFLNKTYTNYEYLISPWSISYTIRLFKKRLLPNYFRKRKWLWLYGAINCESHYDRFKYMVYKKLYDNK